jgi:hypothetical protein
VSYHFEDQPAEAVGAGVTSVLGRIQDLRARDGNLYFVNASHTALFRVELSSGDRFIMSSKDLPLVGFGDAEVGQDSLAPASDRIWTIGPLGGTSSTLTEIDPITGDRVGHASTSGALFDQTSSSPQIWVHPSQPLLILEVEAGILLFDPATDNSNVLSY